jgi:putative oxidoreductase
MRRYLDALWVIILRRLILGGVFVYAGITKIGDSQNFADNIASFQILPPFFINILALGLPPLEIISGAMVIGGWRLRSASFTLLVLTAVFAVALLQALARDLVLDCGCFGQSTPSVFIMWLAFLRDFLLMIAGVGLYCSKTVQELECKGLS